MNPKLTVMAVAVTAASVVVAVASFAVGDKYTVTSWEKTAAGDYVQFERVGEVTKKGLEVARPADSVVVAMEVVGRCVTCTKDDVRPVPPTAVIPDCRNEKGQWDDNHAQVDCLSTGPYASQTGGKPVWRGCNAIYGGNFEGTQCIPIPDSLLDGDSVERNVLKVPLADVR